VLPSYLDEHLLPVFVHDEAFRAKLLDTVSGRPVNHE